MIIFNKFDPNQSIYYNSGRVLNYFFKQKNESILLSNFLIGLEKHLKIEIHQIILALDWLLLNNGISIMQKDGFKYVSK